MLEVDSEGRNPLMLAAMSSRTDASATVTLLLRNAGRHLRTMLSHTDKDDNNALLLAVKALNWDALALLRKVHALPGLIACS